MKMSDYILDDRYQTIMCAIKIGAGPNEIVIGDLAVRAALMAIDWDKAILVSHHIQFDGAILYWHYGHRPKLYACTLSMARALTHAVTGRSSLEAVAEYMGLPPKGKEVIYAMGKRLEDFTSDELRAYAGYCAHDNVLCSTIFKRFLRVFPASELRVVDMVARMFIEPQVMLNPEKLERHLAFVQAEHAKIMAQVDSDLIRDKVFGSSDKFAALLTSLHVDVPMKTSTTTGKIIPALAKGDREFKELCADESQTLEVQALLAARLATKSTIEETRTLTLLGLAGRSWGVRGRGWMPVPLRYSGAHTHRFSGDGGYNTQNFKRGSAIKDAIEAPKGWRIVHRDQAQIEARMVAWLARCWKLLRAFAEKRDVYSEFASRIYRKAANLIAKLERFVGKTAILGLGYGMGAERFKHTLFIGNGGISVDMELQECSRTVYTYRGEYVEIPTLWGVAQEVLHFMLTLKGHAPRRRASTIVPEIPGLEIGTDALFLPNGLAIAYPNLRQEQTPDGLEFIYDGPYGPKRLFGGKVIENLSQAYSRIIVTDIADRVGAYTGYKPFMTTHDSLDWLVPEKEVEWFDGYIAREFTVAPTWAPDIPLSSDGGWGMTLAAAENKANV